MALLFGCMERRNLILLRCLWKDVFVPPGPGRLRENEAGLSQGCMAIALTGFMRNRLPRGGRPWLAFFQPESFPRAMCETR